MKSGTAHQTIINFSIALEALLNTNHESIGFSIKYYSAYLLGDNYLDKVEIIKNITKFYSLRSDIVHGRKLELESMSLITKVGGYIGQILRVTCGKLIEKDVFIKLRETMLGAPKLSETKACIIITEKEIVAAVIDKEGINDILSYQFTLIDNYEFESELKLNLKTNTTENIVVENLDHYIMYVPSMTNINNFSFCISQDENGKFIYIIYTKAQNSHC